MALPAQLSPGLALKGIGVVCAAYLIKGVVMLYQKRMWFRQVAKEHDLVRPESRWPAPSAPGKANAH